MKDRKTKVGTDPILVRKWGRNRPNAGCMTNSVGGIGSTPGGDKWPAGEGSFLQVLPRDLTPWDKCGNGS